MSQYNNEYYQNAGAGGYLAGSPGGSMTGSPGGGDAGKEAKHSLRPTTIQTLYKATQAHTEAEWLVDGRDIGQVTVVAQVIQIQIQATNTVYMLDDGTAHMEARHWIDSTSAADTEKWGGISENAYARVTGTLKKFGNKRYINSTNIRPCTDPHELYFHLAEVLTTDLVISKGMPSAPHNAQQPGAGGNQGGASAYTTQARAPSSQFAGLPDLQRQIMEFLSIQSQDANSEGVHVGTIARAMSVGDATAIHSALDSLMDDGHVYTTIDESHFQIST